jgi:hypothetical protein
MPDFINDEDFDKMLDRAVSEHEDASTTQRLAKAREEQERQDFLSAFRDVMQNVIRPAFEQAAAHSAVARAGGRAEVDINTNSHEARLSFTTRNNARLHLVYRPDYQRKRVNLNSTLRDTTARKIAELQLAEITPDQVRTAIVNFLKEVLSLGGHQ